MDFFRVCCALKAILFLFLEIFKKIVLEKQVVVFDCALVYKI